MDMAKRLRRKFILVAMTSVVVVLAGIIAAINVANYLDICNQADAKLALIQGNGGTLPVDVAGAADGESSGASGAGKADLPNSGEEGDAAVSGDVGKNGGAAASADLDPEGVADSEPPSSDVIDAGNIERKGADSSVSDSQNGQSDPGGSDDPAKPNGRDGDSFAMPRGNTAEMPFETRYFAVTLDVQGATTSVNVQNIAAVSSDEAAQMAQSLAAGASGFSGAYRYSAVQQDDGSVLCVFLDCSRDLGSFTSFLTASVAISLVGLALVLVLVFFLSKAAIRPVVESYQKQKAFITDASHEIKTPLAVISAANEVQEMENGETEWSRSIADQVKRLSGLTEQLVMLARMDEGASRFAKEDVDLSKLLEDTADPFYQLAQQRGKTLVADIAAGVHVQGDAAALTQVVELLLDNATRYALDGCEIRLSLQKHGRKAKLEVSNEVERMPKGNLDRLFERFYRDDSSRSSQTGGSGVGLSVVRSIAEAHGGTAKATAQGNRIIFTVTL